MALRETWRLTRYAVREMSLVIGGMRTIVGRRVWLL
jgi:hypothetical protein